MDCRPTGPVRQVLTAFSGRSRSRTAALLGVMLAVVAAGGFVVSAVRAQTSLSPFEALFGIRSAPVQAMTVTVRPSRSRVRQAHWMSKRHHRVAHDRVSFAHRRVARASTGIGRQAFCVRLCDGYFFPADTTAGRDGRGAQAAACAATCPGAETALYVSGRGSDKITDATAVSDGHRYSALPTALAYTHVVNHACTCGTAAGHGTDLMAILHDMTLRRGDAVMTSAGFRIFSGEKQAVHDAKDFRPLARSRDIDNQRRRALQTLEVASLVGLPRDKFVILDAPRRGFAVANVPGFQALN